MAGPKIDEIGPWSEVKLDILKRYAVEYSKILSNQRNPSFFHVYIDAFAGAGFHLSHLIAIPFVKKYVFSFSDELIERSDLVSV
jgi:hypothetical protein